MSRHTRGDRAVLLLSCPDRRGVVASIAQVLYGHGANILELQQYAEPALEGQGEGERFFQRILIELGDLKTNQQALESDLEEAAEWLQADWRLIAGQRRQRVAIFVSKVNHCLYDLLVRQSSGELNCDVAAVVSNHERLRGVAEQFGIPYHVFEITPATKQEQERAETLLLEELEVDLIVLARYMQILSAEFVERWRHRTINIHHSFLPAFMGARPYRQAHQRGVKLIGATAHYATTDLDEGPIIAQQVTDCSHRDSVPDLVRKGRDLERVVLAHAVRLHLEHRVLVHGNRTVVFDE